MYYYLKILIGLIFLFTIVVLIAYSIKKSKMRKEILQERAGNIIMHHIGQKSIGYIDFAFKNTESLWTPSSAVWRNKESKDYADFWKKESKTVEKMLLDKIKPNNEYSNKALIHFRCSDVPFLKSSEYHLYPKEYYYFATEQINKVKPDEILFVNCSDWCKNSSSVRDPENLCNNYIETIADWVSEKTDIPINRNKICVDIPETYSIMLGSKILVSSGGSFSFSPGLTKGKNFISHNLIGDHPELTEKKYKDLSQKVHWTMWDKHDIIKHSEIPDYNTFDYKNYSVRD